MDSWLKQEALRSPDIKRLAQEEHTSGNKSAHSPRCSTRIQANIHLVGAWGGRGGRKGGAAVGARRAHSPGWRETEPGVDGASPSVHRESRPSTLTPCYLGSSDCKRFLKILGPHHLETKQANCKNKPVDFYFKKANKHKIQEFPTVGHKIRLCFLFLSLPYIVKR